MRPITGLRFRKKIARRMVVLAERYINDRYLPDKAIDLLDESCACAALRNKKLAEYDSQELALNKERSGAGPFNPTGGASVDYEELAKTITGSLRWRRASTN